MCFSEPSCNQVLVQHRPFQTARHLHHAVPSPRRRPFVYVLCAFACVKINKIDWTFDLICQDVGCVCRIRDARTQQQHAILPAARVCVFAHVVICVCAVCLSPDYMQKTKIVCFIAYYPAICILHIQMHVTTTLLFTTIL